MGQDNVGRTLVKAPAIIGLDVGGTKTHALLVEARANGRVHTLLKGPGANYQACGEENAASVFRDIATALYALANERHLEVRAVCLGIAGLDRPKDEVRLKKLVHTAGFIHGNVRLLNDAYLALRAGTKDGKGVAAIAGTGSNCVAIGPNGKHERLGGLCYELGDFGSAEDIGVAAMRAAIRSEDGRAPNTVLAEVFRAKLGLERLDDFVDYMRADATEAFSPAQLAPWVFEAAMAQDTVAEGILERAGTELGRSVLLLLRRSFQAQTQDTIPIIFGGSVLQKGKSPIMREALEATVHTEWPQARCTRLAVPPVIGAAQWALDDLGVTVRAEHLATELLQYP